MLNYKLLEVEGVPFIHSCGFKMTIDKSEALTVHDNEAYLEATLYKEDGTFIPGVSLIFKALDENDQPLPMVNLSEFRSAVDFFFNTLLDTELYVTSVPKSSALFKQYIEVLRFNDDFATEVIQG